MKTRHSRMDGRLAAVVVVLVGGCGARDATRVVRVDRRPNVIVIMTDDQGYGDLGWTGNPLLKTPNLDRLAREGVMMDRFYVSPVCAPTRASLLTGRYNYRTRVVDTYRGRALMDPAEVTLAERLRDAGYRCGIFGKWHLGDNAPMRPIDQGFHESLVHRGGGIAQDSDPPGGSSYYDPVLFRDGSPEKAKGYCSDVFTDAAIRFVEANAELPFFVYLSFNAPHVPLEIHEGVREWIKSVKANREVVGVTDDPVAIETVARVYAMVANIDANVGRLVDRLERLGLAESTVVVFLTDNGPQQARWNAGLRGLKGSVYEGGIRVPCVARWPGHLGPERRIAAPGAHIDLVPTVLEACDVEVGEGPTLDGRSLWKLWTGEIEALPERDYFVQWHRGDVPERGRACAVVGERWKLVQGEGVGEDVAYVSRWELFDLAADAGEKRDLAAGHPEIVERMRGEYDAWFDDVTSQGFAPPRIAVGSDAEEPVVLTRQDWRRDGTAMDGASPPLSGLPPGARGEARGGWEVEIARAGRYRVEVVRDVAEGMGQVKLTLGGRSEVAALVGGEVKATWGPLELGAGPARVEAVVIGGDGSEVVARFVRIERLEESQR